MSGFVATVQSFRQGAHTMPARYYTSPEVFAREQEHLLESRWLCVGRVEQLADPGSYFLQQIGDGFWRRLCSHRRVILAARGATPA